MKELKWHWWRQLMKSNINAQIAAGSALTLWLRHGGAFLRLRLRLSKKLHSLLSSIRRIIQSRGHSCANPRPSRRLGRS